MNEGSRAVYGVASDSEDWHLIKINDDSMVE